MRKEAPRNDAPPARVRTKGRPTLGETAEIDAAIRAAALRILLEQGQGATLNAVAQAAGLSRRSVYARYPNKAQLFIEVIRDLMENSGTLQFDTSGSADDRLYSYILAALNIVSQPFTAQLQRVLVADPVYFDSLQPKILASSRRLLLEPLCRLLEDGVRSGEFAISDTNAVAGAVVNFILARILLANSDGNLVNTPVEQENYARFLTDILTRGFHPRPDQYPEPASPGGLS